jgi:hypothetical protein
MVALAKMREFLILSPTASSTAAILKAGQSSADPIVTLEHQPFVERCDGICTVCDQFVLFEYRLVGWEDAGISLLDLAQADELLRSENTSLHHQHKCGAASQGRTFHCPDQAARQLPTARSARPIRTGS